MNVKTVDDVTGVNVNNTNGPAKKGKTTSSLDYEKLINTPEFKALAKKKKSFLTPYTIFFCVAYGLLPILTAYTSILENSAIGRITWTWMYSFGMFILVWTLATIYTKKAASFDKDVEEILKKNVLN
ncbi:DUF485 domain-containing protein [Sporosarcina sp. FSL K6-1522]|uniref:DUF485 domain-containing protein n=1 Tax=Sporosarcina sp. FSL K6-1522 TaxID=2921554 RepID=UPI00315B033A